MKTVRVSAWDVKGVCGVLHQEATNEHHHMVSNAVLVPLPEWQALIEAAEAVIEHATGSFDLTKPIRPLFAADYRALRAALDAVREG